VERLPVKGQRAELSRLAGHVLPVAEQRFDLSTLLAISALDLKIRTHTIHGVGSKP